MKTLLQPAKWIVLFTLLFAIPVYAAGGAPPVDTGAEATSTDVAMLTIYILMALGFSFLCSIAEAVLLSMTPSYIEGQKEKHPKRAALLKKLKQDNVDQSLAAILTLNTIAHTVGAIGSGAKATVVFGSAWFGVFSAVMTLMILFLSEIIPKTIGAVFWSKLVVPTAHFVRLLIFILFPIVWISEKLTQTISGGKPVHIFSRDEFLGITSIGEKSGQIRPGESRIIRNLLQFDSLKLEDIMTPRTVIYGLPQDITINESLDKISQSPFSRLPIYDETIDNITGFVLKEEVLVSSTQNRGDQALHTLKRDILVISDSVTLTDLLAQFLKGRKHIAIVMDDHGGLDGLVTLEDLIETIMGMEIVDETDNVKDMRILARKQWGKRAKAMGIEIDDLSSSQETDEQAKL